MTTDALPHTHHAQVRHEPPAAIRAVGVIVAMTLGLAVLFIAFGLPAARSAPHDLPIGVAGPSLVANLIYGEIEQKAPGGFAVTTYRDETALRDAIANREAYGGVVIKPPPGRGQPPQPTLLVASGSSPMVAQMLTQMGNGIAMRTGAPLQTVDLAPLPRDDPRGAGLAASALPLTLAGLLPAIVFVLMFPQRVWLGFTATVVFAGVAALTIAAVLRYVFGSIEANFWEVTAGLTLGALATGLTVLGLGSLLGRAGLGAGAAVAMLLGNPLSGLASAPEMLPRTWSILGQSLPQGANGTLLRSTAYFSGAGATTAIVVLTCWAVAGAVLVMVAGFRRGSRKPA
ncbi:ABC transporter permease [Mycolicibacterium sp. P9-64]|uniref:ABC transporter permease n=1 Tax=Mycolicibacterium sp. P9-64 TaxID=2024612 RepID=UPI0011EC127F|nr:ABC transporter permease [Mycolicibacterium sp. P9-64]KAA0086740.1 ABC transporter permease [Mycolicibacterium sp. P9-64]